MPNFLSEKRAPLEFTKSSSRKKIVVCPNCKSGRYVSINWVAGICNNCNKYFDENTALSEKDGESMVNTNKPPNSDFIKLKEQTEKKAYEYKEKVLDQKNKGVQRSHEPDRKPRRW